MHKGDGCPCYPLPDAALARSQVKRLQQLCKELQSKNDGMGGGIRAGSPGILMRSGGGAARMPLSPLSSGQLVRVHYLGRLDSCHN